ncbi:hypothetical protein [Streptomyces sp. NPDC006289]|uniref:hypothetical protein n=1 Tax=Streptomyces sp. NPDC006289 TaxID=3156744 RepID=UPI00339DC186
MRPAQRAGIALGALLLAALHPALLIPQPPIPHPQSAAAVLSGPGPVVTERWRAGWQDLLRTEPRPGLPALRPAVGGAPSWTHTCLRGDEPSCPQAASGAEDPDSASAAAVRAAAGSIPSPSGA